MEIMKNYPNCLETIVNMGRWLRQAQPPRGQAQPPRGQAQPPRDHSMEPSVTEPVEVTDASDSEHNGAFGH